MGKGNERMKEGEKYFQFLKSTRVNIYNSYNVFIIYKESLQIQKKKCAKSMNRQFVEEVTQNT